jgi:TolB-like protein
MHSVAVEPLLDLDTAQAEFKLSNALVARLQFALAKHGPAQVTAISHAPISLPTEYTSGEAARARWNGARIALQGTRRTRDGKLRVSLRFINTETGKVLYRRIIEVEPSDELASTAANLIAPDIYPILDLANLSSAESKDVDPGWRDESTREFLITGRAVMQRRTVLDIDRAIELFQKVVNAEPRSALAYSYLAEVLSARVDMTGDARSLAAAAAAARTANELNANISETHKARCSVLFAQGHFRESLDEAFIAYDLADADDDRALSRVAANFQALGQLDKAAAWLRLALGKGYRPGDNEYSLADCLLGLTDDNAAAAIYRRTSSLFP